MPVSPEERLRELKITLPTPPKPMAKYRTAMLVDSRLFVSGHGPLKEDGNYIQGKVGDDLTIAEGYAAARAVGLAVLGTVRRELGTLDQITRLIRTLGFVNCSGDFRDHPQVINGFSELMAEIFGDEAGVGVRSAVGATSLPVNIAVEIECLFQVRIGNTRP
jgi:enamine deaminase RidA (YjgF/YER057c/UK114 family)